MPNVIANDGAELNATYSVEEFQSVSGLILESWGPSARNADYNKAFDLLLERLGAAGFSTISVNVISRELVRAFPEFGDRSIQINGTDQLILKAGGEEELRTAIGAQQAQLKVNPKSKGGNRTKRVLLYSSEISATDWHQVATGNINSELVLRRLVEPTANHSDLEARTNALLRKKVEEPIGQTNASRTTTTTTAFVRDPAVKAWVLQQASGNCEFCDLPAPFLREDGQPYLEVHHVTPLAEGGSDRIQNAVALCPNCHRRMHQGADRLELRNEVIQKIARLVQEPGS